MRVAIVVRSGPAAGRRILLKAGQLARFGRSNWADFAFAEDAAMADIHFEIRCDTQACYIASQAKESPTLVNRRPVINAKLNTGDLVVAGQTQLAIEIEGGSQPEGDRPEPTAQTATVSEPVATARLSAYIELSAPALALAKSHDDPESFEKLLIDQERWQDAIRWRAHRLPKPGAVAWALACLNDARASAALAAVDKAACRVAATWAEDPSEENRCLAVQKLEANGGSNLGGAIVAAAAWSGGSLAPEGIDAVPPDDRLTGHCVATALNIMSHTVQSPGSVTDRLKRYLQIPF